MLDQTPENSQMRRIHQECVLHCGIKQERLQPHVQVIGLSQKKDSNSQKEIRIALIEKAQCYREGTNCKGSKCRVRSRPIINFYWDKINTRDKSPDQGASRTPQTESPNCLTEKIVPTCRPPRQKNSKSKTTSLKPCSHSPTRIVSLR